MVARRQPALPARRWLWAIPPAVVLLLAALGLAVLPDDPRFPDQWSLRNTGDNAGPLPAIAGVDIAAPAAWNVSTGSRSVIVAISDSAFDLAVHPDLAANLLPPIVIPPLRGGEGFVLANEPTPRSVYHGTAIAGIIGAVGHNGLGMAGINWEVSLLPVRSSSLIVSRIQTIYAAADAGAGIINVSWDLPYYAPQEYLDALHDACLYALEHDLLIVCSAGNDGKDVDDEPEYPCCYDLPNVICVTGLKPDGQQIFNYGDESVHLAAPGVRILVPAGGGAYDYVLGTSFATPMVAGVAALVRGRFPALDAGSVKARILDAVVPMPELADRVISGGRLDAFRAIADPDSIPPAPVLDLAVYDADSTTLLLRWTATGDDGAVGRAAAYDLRQATEPIDEFNFAAATPVSDVPPPGPPGTWQKARATGLEPGQRYYFALKVLDEWGAYGEPGHVSTLSNVASARTPQETDRSAWTATLLGGRPNPFNPRTEIRFLLARPGRVNLRLYDARGRLVASLDGGWRPAGVQGITWQGRDGEGRDLPSGVYYGRLLLDGRAVGAACKLSLIR
jgi:subtilisin family serine protease